MNCPKLRDEPLAPRKSFDSVGLHLFQELSTLGQQLAHTLLFRQGLGGVKPVFPARPPGPRQPLQISRRLAVRQHSAFCATPRPPKFPAIKDIYRGSSVYRFEPESLLVVAVHSFASKANTHQGVSPQTTSCRLVCRIQDFEPRGGGSSPRALSCSQCACCPSTLCTV